MNKIYPTGTFNNIDSNGFILNSAILPIVQVEYQEPVENIKSILIEKFGHIIHSIYIRGSVSKGIAVHNISDIDTVILTNRMLTEFEKKLNYEISQQIKSKYWFIKSIENYLLTIEDITKLKVQFMFSSQCGCIYGNDIVRQIPKFKIDQNAYSHIYSLEKVIFETKTIGHSCEWIMKRIVRVGFELCMIRVQKYTRDLYPCYIVFSEFYPEKKDNMFEALTLAIFPIKDKEKINSILDNLGLFLVNESRNQKII